MKISKPKIKIELHIRKNINDEIALFFNEPIMIEDDQGYFYSDDGSYLIPDRYLGPYLYQDVLYKFNDKTKILLEETSDEEDYKDANNPLFFICFNEKEDVYELYEVFCFSGGEVVTGYDRVRNYFPVLVLDRKCLNISLEPNVLYYLKSKLL